MFKRIVHIGDIPIVFGEFLQKNDLIYFHELLSATDVEELLITALNNSHSAIEIYLDGDPQVSFDTLKKNVQFIIAAGGAVFNENQQLLLIKRLGKWDLPKGKMEPNESYEECAIREVEEECNISGLNITNRLTDTYHMYKISGQWVLKKTIWYRMTTSEWKRAKPQTEEDIEEINWINLKDLNIDSLDTYAAIRYLLRQL